MSRAVVDAVLIDAPPKQAYAKRFDYDGNGNLQYIGWAQSDGSPLITDAKWAIQRLTFTGSPAAMTAQSWAVGADGLAGSESAIWANRASLTYR